MKPWPSPTKLVFTGHAIRQLFARQIRVDEVQSVIAIADAIADYPEDRPFPSRLFLGRIGGRVIHAVIA